MVVSLQGASMLPWCALPLIFALGGLLGVAVRGQGYGADVTAEVGDTVTFNFSLPQSETLPKYLYVFKDPTVSADVMVLITASNTVHPNSPNFSGKANYLGNIPARLITFTLRDVTMANAGLYRCGRNGASLGDTTLIPNCGQKLIVKELSTSLSLDAPCVANQSCVLRCSMTSETQRIRFGANGQAFVDCPVPGSCPSPHPLLRVALINASMFTLELVRFEPRYFIGVWWCDNGSTEDRSEENVIEYKLPSGQLTFGDSCPSGRAVSPARLSCSGILQGTPPAVLILSTSGSQQLNASLSTRVEATVMTGGSVTCSIRWAEFPNYVIPITPVRCDVQVVPSVTVRISEGQSRDKVITCQAEGYPASYNFRPWLHSWGAQEVRHVTGSQQGAQSRLTLSSYQDSGTYLCSVDNGVKDERGDVIVKTASLTVSIEDTPLLPLPSDPAVHHGKRGETVLLYRTLYSVPALTSYNWFFISKPTSISPADHNVTSTPATVLLPVHGRNVTSQGWKVTLEVTVIPGHVGVYSMQACNAIGCRSADVTLREEGLAPAVQEARSLSAGSQVAISVVLTFLVTLGGTLLVVYLVLRHRQRPERESTKTSNVYQNVAFDGQTGTVVQQHGSPSTNPSADGLEEEREGAYSVLDPETREVRRDASTYEPLAVD